MSPFSFCPPSSNRFLFTTPASTHSHLAVFDYFMYINLLDKRNLAVEILQVSFNLEHGNSNCYWAHCFA